MDPINLAVASDLHVGGARSRELWPPPAEGVPDERLVDRFEHLIGQQNLRAQVLVCPGDATHTSDAAEAVVASTILNRMANSLGVPPSDVYSIPGNHDVNWRVLQTTGDETDPGWPNRFIHVAQGGHALASSCTRGAGDLFANPYFSLSQTNRLLVLQVNTAAFDARVVAHPHHGRVQQQTVEAIDAELRMIRIDPKVLRLALVHHHPVQYSNPLPDEPDFSIMVNAGNLLAVLRQHSFDLLVHGHRHTPQLTTSIVDGAHPLVILGAGSFSARLDTRWAGIVNNQFHLLEIEGRSNVGCVVGSLMSWAFVSHPGWIASQRHNGIEHRRHFGLHLLPAQLDQLILGIVEPLLATNRRVLSTEIFQAAPELIRTPLPALVASIERIRQSRGADVFGVVPDDFILVLPRE